MALARWYFNKCFQYIDYICECGAMIPLFNFKNSLPSIILRFECDKCCKPYFINTEVNDILLLYNEEAPLCEITEYLSGLKPELE